MSLSFAKFIFVAFIGFLAFYFIIIIINYEQVKQQYSGISVYYNNIELPTKVSGNTLWVEIPKSSANITIELEVRY